MLDARETPDLHLGQARDGLGRWRPGRWCTTGGAVGCRPSCSTSRPQPRARVRGGNGPTRVCSDHHTIDASPVGEDRRKIISAPRLSRAGFFSSLFRGTRPCLKAPLPGPSLAACFRDGRNQDSIEHTTKTLLGQRLFGIALGYEDLIDHDELRHDPVMAVLAGKLAAKRKGCAALADKSTLPGSSMRPRKARSTHPRATTGSLTTRAPASTRPRAVRDAFDRIAAGAERLLKREKAGVLTISTSQAPCSLACLP
jgi:hypothetical protein